MDVQTPITLTTNIVAISAVGDRFAEGFRRLGIRCVADLLLHLPMRYEHELAEQSIGDADDQLRKLGQSRANVAVRGELVGVRWVPGRARRLEATLADGTGSLRVTWFNMPWLRDRMHPGVQLRLAGEARRRGDTLQLANPRFEIIDPDQAALPPRPERYRPIYHASDEINSALIEAAVTSVLDEALAQIDDHLHPAYRRLRELPPLAEAYRLMHRPADPDEPGHGRRRLAFDELLVLQIAVMLKRRHRRSTLKAPTLKHNAAIDEHILARLPFTLTQGQRGVIDDIAADLVQPTPMNRLLQGDVGAGKTVVAIYGMLMAVASGHQAALMAPTELLAEQHAASIGEMLRGGKVSIELLTGTQPAAQRRDTLARLEAGEIDILIGTHALLTETVQFKSLALVVIDEQHRFGVHQRATLRSKRNDPATSPHTLVMTATPIPRTLSLTVFGDLDVSTIRGKPPGRRPITTRLVEQSNSDAVYAEVAERLARGEQGYIVVPVIDESDLGLTDVGSHLAKLQSGSLAAFRLAPLHGRLSRHVREETMARFRAGEIDVLIATTIIEVGVDVPNASIMVIEHAERFGLAQLHQLRGRIGRATRKSVCALLAEPATPESQARLEAITTTADGFEIAERDLEIRGPGEVFGARQSGLAPFRVADLPRDLDLLRLARRDAIEWVQENPTLAGERDALLRKRLLKAHGRALGLGDVA